MALNLREEDLQRVGIGVARRRNGLVFGMVAGLAFGLTAWGIDAVALGNASVDRPWVKLVIGLTLSLLIGGIAGWLTALIDRAAAGMLLWLCAGIAYAWLVGHLPFDGQSALLRLIEPQLGEITPYPFGESARVRTILLTVIVGALSAMVGALELVLLDRAKDSNTALERAFSIGLAIPFFVLAGSASDGIINEPLRDPLMAVDRVIGWAIEARSTPIDPMLARQRHLGALGGIEDLIGRPYRMSLGAYDARSLVSFSVEVDFDGSWVRCSVLASSPGYCREIDTVYQNALACVADGGQDCSVNVADAVRPWIDQSTRLNEPPASITVLNHIAAVVLVDVTWPDRRHDLCVFRGTQPIILTRCAPVDGT